MIVVIKSPLTRYLILKKAFIPESIQSLETRIECRTREWDLKKYIKIPRKENWTETTLKVRIWKFIGQNDVLIKFNSNTLPWEYEFFEG